LKNEAGQEKEKTSHKRSPKMVPEQSAELPL
jgi:hypothetical protein